MALGIQKHPDKHTFPRKCLNFVIVCLMFLFSKIDNRFYHERTLIKLLKICVFQCRLPNARNNFSVTTLKGFRLKIGWKNVFGNFRKR